MTTGEGSSSSADVDQAKEALRRLCRLEVGEWATREHLFGEAEQEWHERMLDRLVKDQVIETRHHPSERRAIFTLARDERDRFRSLAIVTSLLDDAGVLAALLKPPVERPFKGAQIIEMPLTGIRKNPLRPTPYPTRVGQVIINLPPILFYRLKVRADELGKTVPDFILAVLAEKGLTGD